EAAHEPVKQPAGGIGSLFPSVAHEDPARNLTGGCSHDLGPLPCPDPAPLPCPVSTRHVIPLMGPACGSNKILKAQLTEAKRTRKPVEPLAMLRSWPRVLFSR